MVKNQTMDFRQFQQVPAAKGEALHILAGWPVRRECEWRLAPVGSAAIQIRCKPHLP